MLARSEAVSHRWRDEFVRSFLERDLGQLAIHTAPEATGQGERRRVGELIVGAEPGDPFTTRLANLGGRAVTIQPPQPWSAIGPTLIAADAVALSQRDLPFAQAQLPAKLFDAMALARPIVATAVGELPGILAGCGVIVPPGDVAALARALRRELTDPLAAAVLGQAARERCIERFSWEATTPVLAGVMAQAVAARRSG